MLQRRERRRFSAIWCTSVYKGIGRTDIAGWTGQSEREGEGGVGTSDSYLERHQLKLSKFK